MICPLVIATIVGLVAAQSRPGNYTVFSIDQPIDHFPHSSRYPVHTNETFKQRYVFDDSHYKPGGPVFLYIGGEQSISTNTLFKPLSQYIIKQFMQEFNGLGVILENRYYGDSVPFNSTTTDDLLYLTNENTIADNAYFAQNVKFPGYNASINAPHTPWFVYGASLAGGQSAFTMIDHGDVFYGGIASSGLSHGMLEYGAWYNPIQKYAAQDCVSSINNIVDKFDALLAAKNRGAIDQFKGFFGLSALKDDRDFAAAIAFPIGGPFVYPTNTWQEINWAYPHLGSQDFFDFCRNVSDINPPANNTAIDNALSNYTNGEPWTNLGNYAAYVRRVVLPLCPGGDYDNTECFGTQNQTYWADPTPGFKRSYLYTTCTEIGYYQASPLDGPSVVSRVLRADYTQQWCNWAFPPGKHNSIDPRGPNFTYYNHYGGYNLSADRLAFVDGSADVWRDSGYHSEYAPKRYEQDPLHPELLVNGGGHCWDAYGVVNQTIDDYPQFIREAQLWELRVISRWLRDFSKWKPTKTPGY